MTVLERPVIILSNRLWLSRVTTGYANLALPSVNNSEFGEANRKDISFS